MAEYLIQDATLTGIADAIREKTGSAESMTPAQMASAIAAIETGGGGIRTGLEAAAYAGNGNIAEANWRGSSVPPNALRYVWWGAPPVLLHFPDHPTSFGKYAFYNTNAHFDIATLDAVETAGEYAFAIGTDAANDMSAVTLSLPNFTGGRCAGSGGSRFRSTDARYFGGFHLPKMQTVLEYEWYQNRVANLQVQIGSVGWPVTSCGSRPFGGASGSGTITVYTTGALLDTISAAIRNGAGANYVFVFKAAEATDYGGESYAAGDTMLTSTP